MQARSVALALAVLVAWTMPGRAENVLRWASAIAGLTFDPPRVQPHPARDHTQGAT
jgi:hypothetical protein